MNGLDVFGCEVGFDWMQFGKGAAAALQGKAPEAERKAQEKAASEKRAQESKSRTTKIIVVGGLFVVGLGVVAWLLGGKK